MQAVACVWPERTAARRILCTDDGSAADGLDGRARIWEFACKYDIMDVAGKEIAARLGVLTSEGGSTELMAESHTKKFDDIPTQVEFHVARRARDRYQFEDSLFILTGNVVFANFHAARVFAQKMNEQRDLLNYPEQAVKAGQINAMGLIDEILHHVVGLYRRQVNATVIRNALHWLNDRLGERAVEAALRQFADEFPTISVYRGRIPVGRYLDGDTGGTPNREIVLEEMLLLWLANENPAFSPFLELFDDSALETKSAYPQIMSNLHDFFDTQPPFGPDHQNLIDVLRSPARIAPGSLSEQLAYMRKRWVTMLGDYVIRLLSSLDMIGEEEKPVFFGPGPTLVPEFGEQAYDEPEAFSADREWMPRLVLLRQEHPRVAGAALREYQRPIATLDEVPDEELDLLARWGFSGLWLIGLWERSSASRRIKQLCGNSDAGASAYSLYDYEIAADLGGDAALQDLKDRAWRRGIRLASDMVPNHVGIYSRWIVEHPDWFISLGYSPYPTYTYNGENLSEDERVGIYLEDHYYDHSDAAVVFKRVDNWTGDEKYVYHGNDGTSMPWNDTAQLDYLNPAVREAVVQTILHVARQFPIIRFDAAMTLAKKHFQRLWFPQPGTGGDIPTRAEFGLTRAQFDRAMPTEFWREVVDRVAEEMPDTLLLAEAFWLMEGYFVRTLGMHRVYNSAFMNMLRDEENAKYRAVLKNTLEFDPEIMKRYVNFMNNPDERTAVDQFGKNDKYFGICTMMATLPGLPMFGHGQIEGLTEKYGMEFKRAQWAEHQDPYMVERHEREIAPLLHSRHLFAEVGRFRLYDFFAAEGNVNENVFAYSNQTGDQRSLVIYHNQFATAKGWVHRSVPCSLKDGASSERTLVQEVLGESLALHNEPGYFTIFRDRVSNLEFIRSSRDLHERGLYVELNAYKYHVFVDFREAYDNEQQHYAALADYLNGRGVVSVDAALREMLFRPILDPYRALVNAELFQRLLDARVSDPDDQLDAELLGEVEKRIDTLLQAIVEQETNAADTALAAATIGRTVAIILQLPLLESQLAKDDPSRYREAIEYVLELLDDHDAVWGTLLGWAFTHALGQAIDATGYEERSRGWIDECLFGKVLAETLEQLGLDVPAAQRAVAAIKCMTSLRQWANTHGTAHARAYQALTSWLQNRDTQQFIGVNRFDDVLWFNKESFDELLEYMLLVAVIDILANPKRPAPDVLVKRIYACYDIVQRLQSAADASGYRVAELLNVVQPDRK